MQQVMKYGNFIEASLHGSSAQLTESYKKKIRQSRRIHQNFSHISNYSKAETN